MIKIGITGGIGSGKSIVRRVFSHMGFPTYDADQRAKSLINCNTEIVAEITSLFGDGAYQDGEYRREFVSKQVFSNPDLLLKLNQIVHPAVKLDFENWANNQKAEIVIKEAAIMSRQSGLDKIIWVSSPEELRIKRILKRDTHRGEEQIKKIIAQQKTENEFKEISDFEIINDEKRLLIPQVLKTISTLGISI